MAGLSRSLLRNLQVALNSNAKGQELFDELNEALGAGGSQTDLIFDAPTELIIAAGVVTLTQGFHTVDTQSDAASDDLDTINGLAAGELALITPASGDRTVVVKHATGNVVCALSADISMADAGDVTLLFSVDGSTVIALPVLKSSTGGGAGLLLGSLAALTTSAKTSAVAAINEVDANADAAMTRVEAYQDQLVVAQVAVGDAPGGATDASLTLQLKKAHNGSSNVGSARQVLIQVGVNEYAPQFTMEGSVTFSTATIGSIIASGTGWALVQTDASGAFACTVVNSDDETRYFWAASPGRVSDPSTRCVVVSSNSDGATWS